MSTNNNIPARNVGAPSTFINLGSLRVSNQTPRLLSQPRPQTQAVSHFPAHFQVSDTRAPAHAYTQANVQAKAQAVHAQYQAQIRAQTQSLAQLQNPSIGISSPSSSLLGQGNAKNSSNKPPSRPTSSASSSTSPFKTMELTPASLRKKRKLSDDQLPDQVSAILPESALYTQLLELEAQLDASMARKKTDIQQSLKTPSLVQKTLRIYVYNTFENQGQEASDKTDADPPSWSLKIIGRILQDEKDPLLAGIGQKSYPKFSSFLKKITVSLDQNLYPDNHVILWEGSRSSTVHEGFDVKRKGDKEFVARIRLEMNYKPEKFKLSSALTEILGVEVETRSRIIAAVWHYIKSRRLQSSNDLASFVCDPPLRRIFGDENIKFAMVSEKVSQHLTALPPIHFEHKIKLTGNSPSGTTCYDVLVDVPFPSQTELSAFLAKVDNQKEINAYNELISKSIKMLREHHKRRAFFLGFSQSPGEFINALISSQSKDLKLIGGDAGHSAEKEGRSDYYCQSWVEDAVMSYLNRKSPGVDAPGGS